MDKNKKLYFNDKDLDYSDYPINIYYNNINDEDIVTEAENDVKNSCKKHPTNKKLRRLVYMKKKNKMMKVLKNCYKPTVGHIASKYVNKEFIDLDYIQYNSRSNNQKFFKRVAEKKVRKSSMVPNYSAYKKYFDYWGVFY